MLTLDEEADTVESPTKATSRASTGRVKERAPCRSQRRFCFCSVQRWWRALWSLSTCLAALPLLNWRILSGDVIRGQPSKLLPLDGTVTLAPVNCARPGSIPVGIAVGTQYPLMVVTLGDCQHGYRSPNFGEGRNNPSSGTSHVGPGNGRTSMVRSPRGRTTCGSRLP